MIMPIWVISSNCLQTFGSRLNVLITQILRICALMLNFGRRSTNQASMIGAHLRQWSSLIAQNLNLDSMVLISQILGIWAF